MQQRRFLLALILSAAILVGWSFLQRRFFPVQPQPQSNSNASTAQPQPTSSPTTQAADTAPNQQSPQTAAASPSSVQDATEQRIISIKTPLYEVKLDNHGAVATSWILKSLPPENGSPGRALHSVGSTRENPQPLELIPQGINRGHATFQIVTGDENLDPLLASRNYQVKGADSGELSLDMGPGGPQQQSVEFILQDAPTGLSVVKNITFYADRYVADIEVKIARGGQTIPQVKLSIGPSIGDQGVTHYSFYSVAPEGIAVVNDKDERHLAVQINNKNGDRLALNGPVDWAGSGDTYFAMIAVPPKRTEGLEFRTQQYDHPANGKKESRYLISALVPVPADGSRTRVYAGPKDHYILTEASGQISQALGPGREVDLERSIDYGFLGSVSRPLAAPILWSIKKLYRLTGSYGVAIILFTIVIYSLFFPLKWRSSKSMKKAQKLAPRMKELQEKIKGMKSDDPRLKELQVEQLRLMKEGNPLGGCLPLLIQMPFLFALYRAITISIDFRQASFLWIPDLSSAEPYAIHLLPILFASSMIVLQLITPAPSADPLQRKMMAVGMPLFMLYIMWSAPTGLLVYWIVGNIVGFSQQVLINRLTKSEDDEEPPEEKTAGARSTKKLNTARVSQA
ncbi:MAG TPA: membrane protein insertase YidC [Pyrinomonadaceae bacterium]|jgi:YidC/Oxa1 family membrane protein insertase|nr:membrane protein insertase YidC [Pyrinomonadaceae bacterium]